MLLLRKPPWWLSFKIILILLIKMGLKLMCWLNDYRFKKRGHFSSDLCISRLCIFPCIWYFLIETKTPPCFQYENAFSVFVSSIDILQRWRTSYKWKTCVKLGFACFFFPQKKRYFGKSHKHKVKDEAHFLLWNDLASVSKCIWKFQFLLMKLLRRALIAQPNSNIPSIHKSWVIA